MKYILKREMLVCYEKVLIEEEKSQATIEKYMRDVRNVTSFPFVSLTLATFLIAEFGFLGVAVLTTVQTPRFCGQL